MSNTSTCVIVPHYDHVPQFRQMLPALLRQGLPIVVVDDASPKPARDELAALLERDAPGATLICHDANQGKGGAVMTGLAAAMAAAYSHAVQIDADGQHDPTDIPRFLAASQRHPAAIICGEPQFDANISKLRYYGRYLTHGLAWVECLGREVRDALCGFRLYPLEPVNAIIARRRPGQRMAFDPEILVRAVWSGIELEFLPIKVRYPEDGASHFHYFGDNAEITWMHTRLLAGMLPRAPLLLQRRLARALSRHGSLSQ